MSKLQEIKRTNGSIVNNVTLPKEELEKLDWKKGDDLSIIAGPVDNPEYLKIVKKE